LKKVLSALFVVILLGVVTLGFFVFQRYQQNPEQIVPMPYAFQETSPAIKLEAPILIIGDSMGSYFAKFTPTLADTISVNLSKPIKIQSLAKPGFALHRTLHELKSLVQWPQIIIYQGASEEYAENKFLVSEMPKIKENFDRYNDDRLETFMILYPVLSRIIYEPIKRVVLPEEPEKVDTDQKAYLKRMETELFLFEQQLIQLASMSKDRSSLLILTTTPINLDTPPKQVCEFTSTIDLEGEILGLRDLLKANDPKSAYARSSKLITQYTGNAELLYIHGQISKRIGNLNEAVNSLLQASAYDCDPWRATEVHNSIIRKVAKQQQILLFDFAKLTQDDFTQNETFFDELHPQNLYYDKGMEQLGLVIKSILKL
jgi:hypothetical protein